MILGIDPAKTIGLGLLTLEGTCADARTHELGGRDRHDGARWVEFLELLDGYADRGVTAVAYEKVERHKRHGQARDNVYAAQAYGGAVAIITLWAHLHELAVYAIPVGQAKRVAGKGNASKAAMITAARRRWNVTVTHDTADALWIAEAARRMIVIEGAKWSAGGNEDQ